MTGGTENSKSGREGDASVGEKGLAVGGGARACRCSAGGPGVGGACSPLFDGVLSKVTMTGSSWGASARSGMINHKADPTRTCSRIARARAAGGTDCGCGRTRMALIVTATPFYGRSVPTASRPGLPGMPIAGRCVCS